MPPCVTKVGYALESGVSMLRKASKGVEVETLRKVSRRV
jgi:hypothetical protein